MVLRPSSRIRRVFRRLPDALFDRSERNIVRPSRIPHPEDPQRNETTMQTRKFRVKVPESRSPAYWPEPLRPVPCPPPRHCSASPVAVPMTPGHARDGADDAAAGDNRGTTDDSAGHA